jgi:hypothetical protein
MKTYSMLGSVALFVLGGCIADGAEDPSSHDDPSAKGSNPQEKLNVACAVGTTPNDSLNATPASPAGYSRPKNVIDNSGGDDCGCLDWQGVYNDELALGFSKGQSEDLATEVVPTCRPFTWLQVDVKSIGGGMSLGAWVDSWGATTKAECEASEVLLGVDQLVDGTWQPFYPSPTTPNDYKFDHPMWIFGGCEGDGLSVAVTQTGTYRIKAKGILGAESDGNGYTGIKLTAEEPVEPH